MNGFTKIRLKGWKSIREVDLTLGPLNVLIGANGSGKSNFISFFKLLQAMGEGRLQEHVARVGGANSLLYYGAKQTSILQADIHVKAAVNEPIYQIRLAHAANDTLVIAEEKWAPGNEDVSRSGQKEARLPVVRNLLDQFPLSPLSGEVNSCGVYHFHDTSAEAAIRQPSYIEDNKYLLADARNLPAILYRYRNIAELRPIYDRIVSTVSQINPRFGDFVLGSRALNPSQIMLNWREKGRDYLFGPHQLSDGTLRVIALITLLLQPESELPDIVVIDEPELGLHPYAIGVLAALVRKASHHSQVIVSTQSAVLLNFFESDEVVVVNRTKEESEFRRLDATELEAWLEDYTLGELWEKNVLGGGPH